MRVYDSQAYRKMDVTRECISRILELREILLSIKTGHAGVKKKRMNIYIHTGRKATMILNRQVACVS